MKKEEIIKKYLENGIGFNCNTNKLRILKNIYFTKSKELLFKNLVFLEEEKKLICEEYPIKNTTLDILKRDVLNKDLSKVNENINLTIIALRFDTFDDFIKDITE